ncbi:MAG: hypothetical protein IMF17_03230 [Proteobacteria bacterium]|nr:hypothetical protein [Pseudomonadota bacterium]
MKNTYKLGTLVLLAVSANAFAHHPAADIVDPEVYEMIDENISEVHLDMTFDDMGGDTTDVGSAMEAQDSDVGAAMGGDLADVGAAMEERAEMSSMASVVPAGPAGSQR